MVGPLSCASAALQYAFGCLGALLGALAALAAALRSGWRALAAGARVAPALKQGAQTGSVRITVTHISCSHIGLLPVQGFVAIVCCGSSRTIVIAVASWPCRPLCVPEQAALRRACGGTPCPRTRWRWCACPR